MYLFFWCLFILFRCEWLIFLFNSISIMYLFLMYEAHYTTYINPWQWITGNSFLQVYWLLFLNCIVFSDKTQVFHCDILYWSKFAFVSYVLTFQSNIQCPKLVKSFPAVFLVSSVFLFLYLSLINFVSINAQNERQESNFNHAHADINYPCIIYWICYQFSSMCFRNSFSIN